jgi:hypothetical protein
MDSVPRTEAAREDDDDGSVRDAQAASDVSCPRPGENASTFAPQVTVSVFARAKAGTISGIGETRAAACRHSDSR